MKKNLGSGDRFVRLGLAAVLGILYYNKTVTGTLGIVFAVAAVILVLTSFVSFCPLYAIFGIKTSGKKSENS